MRPPLAGLAPQPPFVLSATDMLGNSLVAAVLAEQLRPCDGDVRPSGVCAADFALVPHI